MKNVCAVADMEQLYELWLQSQRPSSEESSSSTNRENGKQIHMPTDYAEEVVRILSHVQFNVGPFNLFSSYL